MSTKKRWVSNEVWAALDPKAGAIKPIDLRWFAAAAALVAGAAALWLSGLVIPHVTWSGAVGSGSTADTRAKVFSTDVTITNNGWFDVRVVGIGQNGPGLTLLGTDGPPHTNTDTGRTVPFTLKPGGIATVSVTYQVTNCAAVPYAPFAIPVSVDRFWGTQTIGVSLPGDFAAVPANGSGTAHHEWQRSLADQACGSNG